MPSRPLIPFSSQWQSKPAQNRGHSGSRRRIVSAFWGGCLELSATGEKPFVVALVAARMGQALCWPQLDSARATMKCQASESRGGLTHENLRLLLILCMPLARPLKYQVSVMTVSHWLRAGSSSLRSARREGFIVPLPLAEEFFALVLGEQHGGPATLWLPTFDPMRNMPSGF